MARSILLSLLLGATGLTLASGLTTTSSEWFGTWKLDKARSHFRGSTIVIARVGNGYRFDFGATSYIVGDDGRDYATVGRPTTSLQPIGKHEWIRMHKDHGKVLDRSKITLTADGKTMRIDTTAYDDHGKTHRVETPKSASAVVRGWPAHGATPTPTSM